MHSQCCSSYPPDVEVDVQKSQKQNKQALPVHSSRGISARSAIYDNLASVIDPHCHHHCSATHRARILPKPLATRPAHALVAARGEDVRLGLIQAHNARLAVGVVHRISRRPLLGDLVD